MDVKPKSTIKDRKPIFRDIWEFFIKLLLIVLLVFWFLAELLQSESINFFVLLLILVLIAGLIALIWRQRHFIDLHCKLTDPSGCVAGSTSILPGHVLEPIPWQSHQIIKMFL
jgi:hypothetical protein